MPLPPLCKGRGTALAVVGLQTKAEVQAYNRLRTSKDNPSVMLAHDSSPYTWEPRVVTSTLAVLFICSAKRNGKPSVTRQWWWGCGLLSKDIDFTAHSPIAYNYREIKFYNTRPQICTLRSVRAGGFQCFKTDLSSAKK